jgi:hypothetical protein
VRALSLCGLVVIAGCSVQCSSPEKPRTQEAAAEVAPPEDQSRHFPNANLVKMDVVRDHLLDQKFMPGGNLANYQQGSTKYQQFLAKLPDAQQAAFLLLDWKKALGGAKYLAHMGGYYGTLNGRPLYVFAKGPWIAGVVGLAEEKADPIARQFASRL